MSRLTDALVAGVKAFVPNPAPSVIVGRDPRDYVVADSQVRALVDGLTPAELYDQQPHLRTVVDFVARNTAQLGRHVFKPDGKGGRVRVRDGVAARLAETPNEYMTGYELVDGLVHELGLWGFAIWLPRVKPDGDWAVDPIPGGWLQGMKRSSAFQVGAYVVKFPGQAEPVELPASSVVVFRSYSSDGPRKLGSSPISSLRGTLSEQLSAVEFRRQLWARGGRVGSFLTRPAAAPPWSQEARDKFLTEFRGAWSGSGGSAGATPFFEDGMELKRVGFSAKDEQWLEAATLSLTTVAGAYHVPPTMVGAATGSTFASTREFRKMLYTETLGPLIAQVEGVWNGFLMPFIDAPAGEYLELNIAEKLQGDFVEQGAMMQSAAGGPYMTRDEVRALVNLPALGEGAEELIVPMNVTVGGQASPTDSGSQNDQGLDSEGTSSGARSRRLTTGSVKASKGTSTLQDDLVAFFTRQRKAILASATAKSPSWWDDGWDDELSATLLPHLIRDSTGTARAIAGAKGLDPDAYSVGRTRNFLAAVADSRAAQVNRTTRDHFTEAIDEGYDLDDVMSDPEARGASVAQTVGTFLAAWATVEVVTQLAGDKSPRKTWVASGLPNSRHADLDGETVPVGEPFSNGAMWPGDPVLGAEGVANCGCGVDVDYD